MNRLERILEILNGSSSRLRESYFEKNYSNLKEEINLFTQKIEDISFKERMWYWVNDIDIQVLCKCGRVTTFHKNWQDGYRKYCTPKCAQTDNSTKEKRKNSVIERYGVDNIAKLDETKKKQEYTNLERYGTKSSFQNKDVQKKWKYTIQNKWGVSHISKSQVIKDKITKTIEDKYGVDHFSKTDEFKEKIKNTNNEKYGVDWFTQSTEFKEKTKRYNIIKYGVDHFSKTDEFKEKIKNINNEKYGVDFFYQSDVFKDMVRDINNKKYGVNHHTESSEYRDKIKLINQNLYNRDWFMQTDLFKEKSKHTMFNNFGVDHYSKTDEFKDKIIKTSFEKWGVSNYSKTKECKEKIKNTNNEKYGVDNISKSEFYRKSNYNIAKDEHYIVYIGDSFSLFNCDFGENHLFKIHIDNYIKRKFENVSLCTVCNPIGNSSIKEKELLQYIQSIYNGEIIQSYRDGLEIDIYLPLLKIGFEFNGLHWHSDKFKEKNYHIDKTNYFGEKGIRIIHIWEDDWDLNKNIVKSQIRNWLRLTERKIFARNCEVREIKDSKLVTKFLNDNHIQGPVRSNLKLGLYKDSELVSLMTFDHLEGRKRMDQDCWNLSRFCNKLDTRVVGGASKLLKYFIDNYHPIRIISYSDRDWSAGDLYIKLGFDILHTSDSDYKYVINKKRIHKSNFKKSITGISESKLDIVKVWDCGKIKFQKSFKNCNI
jgi:hypothetical protein